MAEKGNTTGLLPANGHRIQGRSSEDFLDVDEILGELNLKGDETLMDAGCGDGHVAIRALDLLPDGVVYALDVYEPSIEDMKKYKSENNVDNLIPVQSDIADKVDVDDDVLDVVLLVNVFHGFNAMRKMDEACSELKRIIKPDGGRIAIMDYKKQDVKHGPPFQIRCSPEDIEEVFAKQGLKLTYLNEDIGEDIPEGKSHYFVVFEYA